MSRRLWQGAVLILAFAVVQLLRPSHANPPIVPGHTLAAELGTGSGLPALLDRSCGDCHSNRTAWPWYARIAPLSWAMTYGVAEGRKAVNFSEWAAYPPAQRRQLLTQVCQDVSTGRMPGSLWTRLHPEARLSPDDIGRICAATQQAAEVIQR